MSTNRTQSSTLKVIQFATYQWTNSNIFHSSSNVREHHFAEPSKQDATSWQPSSLNRFRASAKKGHVCRFMRKREDFDFLFDADRVCKEASLTCSFYVAKKDWVRFDTIIFTRKKILQCLKYVHLLLEREYLMNEESIIIIFNGSTVISGSFAAFCQLLLIKFSSFVHYVVQFSNSCTHVLRTYK